MNDKEFLEAFDAGSDEIDKVIDWNSGTRPGLEVKRVNVDFPTWMVEALDRESRRVGVPRQAIIKTWLAERLEYSMNKDKPF